MHYDAVTNDHGLKHDPFKALVAPRPIGWISTVGPDGATNLAPYSFFNAVAEKPSYVMFSSSGRKDTLRNIEDNGEFVCSLATYDLRHAVSVSSATVPYGVSEFPIAGVTISPSQFVKPPRVAESPAALECRLWKTVELPKSASSSNHLVIGLVVGVYIDDRFVRNGIVDTKAMRPIGRMGYREYSVVTAEDVFEIDRPVVAADGRVTSGR